MYLLGVLRSERKDEVLLISLFAVQMVCRIYDYKQEKKRKHTKDQILL